jgi:FAD/FMN-containing dehydrogenase
MPRIIAASLALCNRYGAGVVPQGGLSGLAGAANPGRETFALSLARFAGIEEIDRSAGVMVVRAGTLLQHAQEGAQAAGLFLPIDLPSRGSCQIGGVISTNAGGLRVIRHGNTRDNLLGLEVVLADGRVLSHLQRVKKDNTGYALQHLFCGAEGTLGVITRAVLRLVPPPPPVETAICALDDFDAVLALLELARAELTLSAFEVMWKDFMHLFQGARLFSPLPPLSVIIEIENRQPQSQLQPLLEQAYERGIITDALLAQSMAEAQKFWDVREALITAPPDWREVINLDVSLPLSVMAEFVETCRNAILAAYPMARTGFFGHLGDSNLHIMASQPGAGAALAHAIDAITYPLVRERGGSISAEHGVGVLKRNWLDHSRSADEIATMRAIKAALDPRGIMNPGKVI